MILKFLTVIERYIDEQNCVWLHEKQKKTKFLLFFTRFFTRNISLQARNVALQVRNVVLQARNVALQARNVALQARNVALQARNVALQARNKTFSPCFGAV